MTRLEFEPNTFNLVYSTRELSKVSPVVGYAEKKEPSILATPRPNNCSKKGEMVRNYALKMY